MSFNQRLEERPQALMELVARFDRFLALKEINDRPVARVSTYFGSQIGLV